eukprot:scaffold2621_cov124-Isochrysis_galbana.AAC.10
MLGTGGASSPPHITPLLPPTPPLPVRRLIPASVVQLGGTVTWCRHGRTARQRRAGGVGTATGIRQPRLWRPGGARAGVLRRIEPPPQR